MSMHTLDGKRLWQIGPDMPGLLGHAAVAVGDLRGDGSTLIVAAGGFFGYDEEREKGTRDARELPPGFVLVISLEGEVLAQRPLDALGNWVEVLPPQPGSSATIFIGTYAEPILMRYAEPLGEAPAEGNAPGAAPKEPTPKEAAPTKSPGAPY